MDGGFGKKSLFITNEEKLNSRFNRTLYHPTGRINSGSEVPDCWKENRKADRRKP